MMTEFFGGRVVNELIQRMLAYIKTQVENPRMPESGFMLDKIMHLHINSHKLGLTRVGSFIDLLKWIKNKVVLINPQNKDEQCFKWAVIAALHPKEITKDPQRISKLKPMKTYTTGKDLSFQYQSRI